MEHILRLILKNFKSYRDQVFEFHPGINIIKGEGLSGKTNIFRAIKLLSNYSSKKNIKWRFALANDPVNIELVTAEENRIEFVKKNQVKFKLFANDHESEFRKIGQATPEEIKRYLMLDDINFQSQLDLPFIVQNSESKLTKIINSIMGIDKVDEVIRKLRVESKYLNDIVQKESFLTNQFLKRQNRLKELTAAKAFLSKAKKISKRQELVQNDIVFAYRVFESVLESKSKIEKLEKSKLAKIEVKLAEKIDSEIKAISEKLKLLKQVKIEIARNNDTITQYKKQYKQNLKEYINTLKLNKICPFCSSPITSNMIIEIRKSLKNEINIDQ